MNFGHWVDHAGIVGKRNFCQCHLDRGLLEVVVIKVVIIVAPQWEVMGRFQANTGNPALRLTSKFRAVLNLSGTAVATNSGGVAPGGQRLERGVGVRTALHPAQRACLQRRSTTQVDNGTPLSNVRRPSSKPTFTFVFGKPLNGAPSRE